MSTILDNPALFLGTNTDVTFKPWADRFTGSQGYSQLLDPAPTYTPDAQFFIVNSLTHTTPGFNTYFKLQGFNPATGNYEVWHSMNTPQVLPPSGDQLINIQVIATWTDR